MGNTRKAKEVKTENNKARHSLFERMFQSEPPMRDGGVSSVPMCWQLNVEEADRPKMRLGDDRAHPNPRRSIRPGKALDWIQNRKGKTGFLQGVATSYQRPG